MSVAKAKIKAALWHGCITLVVAFLTALVVFRVWFPGEFSQICQGTGLYVLVLGVEVVLGPVMSLVIYDNRKPRRELILDYVIVLSVQLCALVYGLFTVVESRPVYLVFVKDRIEVVTAGELSGEDLEAAADGFENLSWVGPRLICVTFPDDVNEKANLINSALSGKDIQLLPKYYRDCGQGEIIAKAHTKQSWVSKFDDNKISLPVSLSDQDFTWLPVVSRFGVWTALFTADRPNEPVYIKLDSF